LKQELSYRRYKKTEVSYTEYKKLRNEANRRIKADRVSYRKKVLNSFKGKPKKFYGYMRRMKTVKEKVHQIINRNGQFTTSDGEAALVLGEFFTSVFVKEDGDQNSSHNSQGTRRKLFGFQYKQRYCT